MKLPKRFPTKLIIVISAIIIGGATGAALRMTEDPNSNSTVPQNSVQQVNEPEGTSNEVQSSEETAAVTALEAPQSTETIETNTNPPTDSETQESAPNEQPEHAFAEEMAAAGVESKDYETVYALVLYRGGWRIIPNSDHPFVWRFARQVNNLPTLTDKLIDVKVYVGKTYGGDWNKAFESARTRGNF